MKKGDSVKFVRERYALRGKVHEVVPAGVAGGVGVPLVDRCFQPELRDHESYVVKVGWKYYWPKNMDFL